MDSMCVIKQNGTIEKKGGTWNARSNSKLRQRKKKHDASKRQKQDRKKIQNRFLTL